MSKNTKSFTAQDWISVGRKVSSAAIASTLILAGFSPQLVANAAPLQISQRQQDWNAVLSTARWVNAQQEVTALVLQLDVLDKPETTYANAVYQIFARVNGQWTEIYTNTGARLLSNASGRTTLPPEVIPIRDLRLGQNMNLANLELRSVVKLRYDANGRRDQEKQWEQVQSYRMIATTTTPEIASRTVALQSSSVQSSTSQVVTSQSSTRTTRRDVAVTQNPTLIRSTQTSQTQVTPLPGSNLGQPNNQLNPHRGHFSLGILQSRVTYPEVIARISILYKRPDAFLAERFIGDFRYRMNQRAQFIRGLNPGDRIVVRLFTPDNNLIGYSEFELLSDFAAVNLILPSQTSDARIVRTVYGVDSDRNGMIDSNAAIYDYFTQLSGSSYQNSQVTFLRTTQNINTQLFTVQGLPAPRPTCAYTDSFSNGNYALVNRTISVFRPNLASAIMALPGRVVQVTSLNSTSISTYEVSRQILTYEQVGVSSGNVVEIDNVESGSVETNGRNDRRRCNQGIGNGAEGCDPGNSRPHGGSNDETGRTPGNNRNR
jgi:hypothetical protein